MSNGAPLRCNRDGGPPHLCVQDTAKGATVLHLSGQSVQIETYSNPYRGPRPWTAVGEVVGEGQGAHQGAYSSAKEETWE